MFDRNVGTVPLAQYTANIATDIILNEQNEVSLSFMYSSKQNQTETAFFPLILVFDKIT